MNENETTDIATDPGKLRKAFDALGTALGLSKGIIGHEGVSADTPAPTEPPFGENPADHASPTGESVPAVAAPDAGAEARIDAARDRSREAGAAANTSGALLKSDGTVTTEELYDYLKSIDPDGRAQGAIEISEPLARLTETVFKGLSGIEARIQSVFEERLVKLETALAEIGSVQKSMAQVEHAMAESILDSQGTVSAMAKSLESAPVRTPAAGVGIIAGTTPAKKAGAAPPEGMSKGLMSSGLMKAVNAGKLNTDSYSRLATMIDTTPLPELWANYLNDDLRQVIAEN